MTDVRYPIGAFALPASLTPSERSAATRDIDGTPSHLRAAVDGLSTAQLDTPYRAGGWTVRQVVHHLPDSHMNAHIRLKLALTEDVPAIRTYDQGAWAGLVDAVGPIEPSLALLERLHIRWVYLWQRLTDADWERRFYHPEMGEMRVDQLCALYAWHGRHHVAHITALRARESW